MSLEFLVPGVIYGRMPLFYYICTSSLGHLGAQNNGKHKVVRQHQIGPLCPLSFPGRPPERSQVDQGASGRTPAVLGDRPEAPEPPWGALQGPPWGAQGAQRVLSKFVQNIMFFYYFEDVPLAA